MVQKSQTTTVWMHKKLVNTWTNYQPQLFFFAGCLNHQQYEQLCVFSQTAVAELEHFPSKALLWVVFRGWVRAIQAA